MADILSMKKQCQSKAPLPTLVFIPDELIAEILSFLKVKTILRLKSVCKSWNSLVSDSTFVKKHLKKSSQNPHLILTLENNEPNNILMFPIHGILENPSSITVHSDSFHHPLKDEVIAVGSCNGLLCFLFGSISMTLAGNVTAYQNHWFRFRNPSTRTTSKELGLFRYSFLMESKNQRSAIFKFMFGYDDSHETYKVVAFRVQGDLDNIASWKSEVKVYRLNDNCWRNVQGFHVIPFKWLDYSRTSHYNNHGVHLSGTINWLAVHKYFRYEYLPEYIAHVGQFVIVMFDLSTETFKQLLLPQGFDEVPFDEPVLSVLTGCLCFSYDFRKTEFVLWQMKEYGVHESWKQLFKISYYDMPINNIAPGFPLACLYMNMNDGKVIFATGIRYPVAIIYNLREYSIERINTNCIQGLSYANDYVESLVSVL